MAFSSLTDIFVSFSATEYHLGLLKAKLAKFRQQLLDGNSKKSEKVCNFLLLWLIDWLVGWLVDLLFSCQSVLIDWLAIFVVDCTCWTFELFTDNIFTHFRGKDLMLWRAAMRELRWLAFRFVYKVRFAGFNRDERGPSDVVLIKHGNVSVLVVCWEIISTLHRDYNGISHCFVRIYHPNVYSRRDRGEEWNLVSRPIECSVIKWVDWLCDWLFLDFLPYFFTWIFLVCGLVMFYYAV